ncbi:MAG TPA: hypothetical protein VF290_17720 [Pyrinomonadaceae bacterium]
MQGAKSRNRGEKTRAKAQVGIPVLTIFRNKNNTIIAEKFEAVGPAFRSTIERERPNLVTGDLDRTQIHRIVFFNTDEPDKDNPILLLDVHPSSKLTLSQSLRQIDLNLVVTTPFAVSAKRLNLTAQIKIRQVNSSLRPVFLDLDVLNAPGTFPARLMSNISGDTPDRLARLLQLNDDKIPVLEHRSFDSGFLKKATGIAVPASSSTGCSGQQQTKFRFIKLPGNESSTVKTLELRLDSIDLIRCNGGTGSVVVLEPGIPLSYDANIAPREWHFIQRPAKGINAAKPVGDGRLPRAKWLLKAEGIPWRSVLELWNELVEQFQLAVLRSRAGHGVSFFPTFTIPSSGPETFGRWVSSYQIIDTNTPNNDVQVTDPDSEPDESKIVVRPLSLQMMAQPPGNDDLLASLEQIRNIDDQVLETVKFKLTALNSEELEAQLESTKGLQLEIKGSALTDPKLQMRPKVRMGSLDLEFSNESNAHGVDRNFFLIRPRGTTIDVDSSYQLEIKRVSPGGQDYAVSEEFTASSSVENEQVLPCVRPKPPIVIPLDKETNDHPILVLHVQEKLNESVGSHRLVLDLISQSPMNSREPDLDVCRQADRTVVVLDRNPFLVAEVKYLSFDRVGPFSSGVIATWNSDDGIAGAWQLQLEERPFCMVLPPQAVGEEMIKDQKLVDPVKAVAFNLGPATTFELNARRARTDFAETPWNLRRILAMQGQTQNGAGVKSMHYELLYGLSADAKNPGIRLADTFSQAGRTMPIPDERIAWAATKEQRDAYAANRFDWGRLYYRLLSRLAVLVPWDELLPLVERKPIVLSESVSSRLRLPPKSNLKRPVDLFTGDGNITEDDGSLKGGATWGFESKNIYKAVRDNSVASSARLENFGFSSLGGYGKQEAGFQSDLTKISAEVAMGRAFHYQVERLGRIACTYHLAKHVIVYERSVTPSRQFQNPTQPLLGWPILRKVREYVQILEPKRSYPDDTLRPDQQRTTDEFRKRGFLDSCEFEEGVQISVNGAWGSDVGDYGWKIPLWRTGATPEDVYPKPVVHFGLDSNQGEQQKVQRCELDNPENLYFFTLTKNKNNPTEKVDPDPRNWDPELNIDYVNRPVPAPATGDFTGGDPRAMSPGDPSVPVHYGPCTFRLVPSSIPADLVSMRAAKPMAAVIETITIVRSVDKGKDTQWPPTDIVKVNDLHQLVGTMFRDLLLKNLPLDGNPTATLISDLKARVQSFTAFKDKLTDAKREVKAFKDNLLQRVQNEERAIAERIRTRLMLLANQGTGEVDGVAKELQRRVTQYLDHLGNNPLNRDEAIRILLETQHRFEEVLLISSSLPGLVTEFIARYVELVTTLRSTINDELARIKAALANSSLKAEAAAAQATVLYERTRAIVQALETIGLTPPLPFLPDPGPEIREKLNTYFDGFKNSFEGFLADIRVAVNTGGAIQAIDRFQATAYFRALQDLANLRDFIRVATGVTIDIGQTQQQIADAIDKAIHPAQQWQDETLKLWRDKVVAAAALIQTEKSQLEAARDQLNQFLETELDTKLQALNQMIADRVTLAANVVVDALSAAEKLLEWEGGVKDKILTALDQGVEEAKHALETYRDELFSDAGKYLDQAARLLPSIPVTYQQADDALRLIRAFGEPPRVPKLEFDRPQLAYFYKELNKHVDLTPAVALLSQANDLAEKLKPLGVKLPTRKALEQLVPIDLKEFDVSRIFPSFAGIDFSNFLAGRKLPTLGNENVRITQGIDAQTRRGFVRADVHFVLSDASTLFAIGPLTLQIINARFNAVTEITVDLQGKTSRKTFGSITADWLLTISNVAIIKFRDTELKFDDNNNIRFSLNPKNIELPEIMSFVSQLMTFTGEDGTGLTIGLIPGGVQSILSLPIPDVQGATSGISNLNLLAMMALRFDNGFSISVGLGLARKQAPFSLTIFILGGGGFVEAWVTYTPSTRKLSCSVEIGITVSASVAIALGPIKGGVYVYFGITALYESGRGLSFGVLYVIRGQVSVLGIVSACVTLMLEARYSPATKQLVGRGRFSIKIKICWCFTLEIDREVTYTIGGGNNVVQARSQRMLEAHHASEDDFARAVRAYINMLD